MLCRLSPVLTSVCATAVFAVHDLSRAPVRFHERQLQADPNAVCAVDTGTQAEDFGLQPHEVGVQPRLLINCKLMVACQ